MADFLDRVEEHSIRGIELKYPDYTKPVIDWASYQAEIWQEFDSKNPQTIDEVMPVIQSGIDKLDDGHSCLMRSSFSNDFDKNTQMQSKHPTSKGELIHRNIGYLKIPKEMPTSEDEAKNLSHLLRQELVRLDRQNLKGWVIDLRCHIGGGMYGGLSALWPLIKDYGVTGHFVPKEHDSWEENLMFAHDERFKHEEHVLRNKTAPISVLYGENTASAGEAIAVAFRGLRHVKSFGTETAGMTTGNVTLSLPDGRLFALASCVYADRHDHVYGAKLQPDYVVENMPQPVMNEDDNFDFPEGYDVTFDPAVIMASRWIQQYAQAMSPGFNLK